jgi:polyphenol oxidase
MAIRRARVLIKEIGRLLFFQFLNMSRFTTIHHGIFTRKGGFSSKPFNSLNISFGVGDNIENVKHNRHVISEFFGTRTNNSSMVYLNQIHSDRVRVLSHESMPTKLNDPGMLLSGDAIVTDLCNKNLVIQVADCQAILLYDPVRRVVANVHSGWRGSIQNVVGKTVNLMNQRFMSNPKDIVAGIGPSLGPCCSEFVNYRTEIPETLWKYKINGKHFDFWSISQDQMKSEGILDENIETSGICTKCRTDLFFSYRGERVTGRFSAVLGLKK